MRHTIPTRPTLGPRPPVDLPPPRPPRSRRRTVSWVLALVALVATEALVTVLMITLSSPQPGPTLARTDPAVVAVTFTQRYVEHDPAACGLAAGALYQQLELGGQCTGPVLGPTVAVSRFTGPQVCGNHALVGVQIIRGDRSTNYALVGLGLGARGWSVVSVLVVTDPTLVQVYPCSLPPGDGN